MTELVNDFQEVLLSLDRLSVKQILDDQLERMTPIKFIEDVVVVALDRIGARWNEGTVSLSQVYMTGRICEDLVDELLPPESPERKDKPNMAICVLSDHHKFRTPDFSEFNLSPICRSFACQFPGRSFPIHSKFHKVCEPLYPT